MLLFLLVSAFLDATPDFHRSALVVRAVRARYELAVGVVTGKPALEIVLLDSCVV